LASYATPELHGLFEDWLSQIEEEMRADIEKQESVNPDELTKKYKLSKESIYFILVKLAQNNKINIKAEKK
jgi:Mor family transcriptional regulator